MKAARILMLGIALAAGGAAACLVSGDDAPKPETGPAPVVQQFPTADAVSTEISAETGAGGFILPNDRGRGEINAVRLGVNTTR